MTDQTGFTPDGAPPVQEPSFVKRIGISPVAFGLICLFVIFILYQIVGGTATLLLIGANVTRANVTEHRVMTLVGQTLFLLIPTLIFARLLDKRLSLVFPWRMPRAAEIIFASLALLFLQEVFQIYLLFEERIPLPYDLQKIVEPMRQAIEEMFKTLVGAQSIPELLFVMLVVAIAPSIIEEFLFRGLIQSSFERAMKPARAALLAGIIFGLFHFNPFAAIPLMGLGWYFGYLRMRSKSIVLAMTIHFLNNGFAVVVSHFRMDDQMVIGASKGPDINIPAIVAQFFLFSALFIISFASYLRVTNNLQAESGEDHR